MFFDFIPREDVEAELDRVVGSPAFLNAPRHTRFLRFVVEKRLRGEAENVKEYLIGVEVFDRPTDYDPAVDAIVRAEARRLRRRLAEYYQTLGQHDLVVIDLPKGTYVPVFRRSGYEGDRFKPKTLTDAGLNAELPGDAQELAMPPTAGHSPTRMKPHAEAKGATGQNKDSEDSSGCASRVRRKHLLWSAAALALIGVALAVYERQKLLKHHPTSTNSVAVVLSALVNQTEDPVFEDTLEQGLRLQLEQSPFLEIVSESKVNQALKLMGQSQVGEATPKQMRDACERLGGTVLVSGSIARFSREYVLSLNATSCGTGEALGRIQERSVGKDNVLKALDRSASALRKTLGESLSSVQQYSRPLEEATTPSLDALKAYSVGRRIWFTEGAAATLPFYEWASRLDPNFAMPYVALSIAHSTLGETGKSAEYARRAYELRGNVSERERFSIEATYYLDVNGQLDKAAQTYEVWQKAYPRDRTPYSSLPFIYGSLGEYDKALQLAQEILNRNQNNESNYNNVCAALINLNRFAEADGIYKESQQHGLNGEQLLSVQYSLAFFRDDEKGMERTVASAKGKPGIEHFLLAVHADTKAWHGQLSEARALTQEAAELAMHNDAVESAAAYKAAAALREVVSGNRDRARIDADSAMRLASTRDVLEMAALALAMAGETEKAEKLVSNLRVKFPLDTLAQQYWIPTIQSAVALSNEMPKRAVELLRTTGTIELGMPTIVNVYLCPVYLRGQAYLKLGNGPAAAIEFQKFVDHRGLVGNFQWGALARLGLARAYSLTARHDPSFRNKAQKEYGDFLAVWKDADPDISILRQVKVEYAKVAPASNSVHDQD